MRSWCFPLALLVLAAPAGAVEPAKVRSLPIVERSIAHHGGEVYRRSRSALSICSRSGCFAIEAVVDGDRFDYTVTGGSGEGARRVRWTNDGVEEWRGGAAVKLDDAAAQRARDFVSARVYFPFLPFRLADYSVWLQDFGLETWEGRVLHKVRVSFAAGSSTDAGDEYLYWFDPATARLEQLAYSFGTGANAGLRFRRGVRYREIGGLLLYDQENFGIDGPDLSVELVTPSYVAESMKPISVVELKDVRVERLP